MCRGVRPHDVWAMNSVRGQLATGKMFGVLTVVDFPLAIHAKARSAVTYLVEDVVRILDQVCPETGHPKTIRVDQGSEFLALDLDHTKGVALHFPPPGKKDTDIVEKRFMRSSGWSGPRFAGQSAVGFRH